MVEKKEDISGTTVLILVIFAILISIICTWTVMNAITSAKINVQEQVIEPHGGKASATVGLYIGERPPEETEEIK